MRFSTKGLILRQQNIGEQDRLVWVLSDSHGVFRAFVRRAQNIKSPKCAGTGLLCCSKLTVFEGRDAYTIDEAEAIEQFIGLRSNVENMALAQYFCELCLNLCPKEQEAEDYLRLALNAIYLLSKEKRDPLLVKLCFEMRLISLCGYMPDLVMCPECGAYEKDEMVFVPSTGRLYCYDCARERGVSGLRMNRSMLLALRHTVYADFERLFAFELPHEMLEVLSSASECYIQRMTGKDFETLKIVKALRT